MPQATTLPRAPYSFQFTAHWLSQHSTSQACRKAKLSLGLINWESCHKDIWGSGGIAPPFVTSALDGDEWSASGCNRYIPGENAPNTHLIGSWVGPWAGVDAVGRRKIACSCRESNPSRLAGARRYTHWGISGYRIAKNYKVKLETQWLEMNQICSL
jgi:hypothetical protein